MENKAEEITKRIVKKIVKGIVLFLIFLIVMGAVVYGTQWLWNWLVPSLFGGPVITYWQTLGLLVLTRILTWPWSRGGGHWGRSKGAGYWAGRWRSMTPEQRESLKARMRDKWCPQEPAQSANDGGANPQPGA